jgi:hypothetical protein
VPDDRWGKWVAYDASIARADRVLREQIPDAAPIAPFPLHVSEMDGAVWIPQQLGFPLLIQRALIAASGLPPNEIRLSALEHRDQLIARSIFGTMLGGFDPLYRCFLDAGDASIWLQYEYVPPEVVDLLCEKLGCRKAPLHLVRSL